MTQRVKRSREELAQLLTCQLCGDVLRDPQVSTQCSHTACYACFAKHWIWGGSQNKCPLCEKLGLPQTVLGPYPIAGDLNKAPRLQRDYALVSLLRKLFPRPAVDAEVQAHEDELAAIIRKRPHDNRVDDEAWAPLPSDLLSYRDYCPLLLVMRRNKEGDEQLVQLQRPYLALPWMATVDIVRRYVLDRLDSEGHSKQRNTKIYCQGHLLHPQASLLHVQHTHWGEDGQRKLGLLVLEFSVDVAGRGGDGGGGSGGGGDGGGDGDGGAAEGAAAEGAAATVAAEGGATT